MLITKISSLTGIEHTRDIPVKSEQMEAWRSGQLIQNAMPNISTDDREFLISGVVPEEWDTVFGK